MTKPEGWLTVEEGQVLVAKLEMAQRYASAMESQREEAKRIMKGWQDCIEGVIRDYGGSLEMEHQIHLGQSEPVDSFRMMYESLRDEKAAADKLLESREALLRECAEALKNSLKIPKPWMGGKGVDYSQWTAAFDSIEAALAKLKEAGIA